MRVIRAAECQTMPWKNGGGETTEIAVFPPDGSLETFDWRISRAKVASDGPFSAFPGIDRSLTVIEGRGIRLAFADGAVVDLDPSSPPFAFDGGIGIDATLAEGPITDLNVMTRRGKFAHEVTRLNGRGRSKIPKPEGVFAAYCSRGAVSITNGETAYQIAAGDMLLADEGPSGGDLSCEGDGEILVIDLRSLHRINDR